MNRAGTFIIHSILLKEAFAPIKCSCGAASTSNPNLHTNYCDLTTKKVHPTKAFLAETMIVRAEHAFFNQSIEYTGYNDAFDDLAEGAECPKYQIIFSSTNGTQVKRIGT